MIRTVSLVGKQALCAAEAETIATWTPCGEMEEPTEPHAWKQMPRFAMR